jgi:hypothetical protein
MYCGAAELHDKSRPCKQQIYSWLVDSLKIEMSLPQYELGTFNSGILISTAQLLELVGAALRAKTTDDICN